MNCGKACRSWSAPAKLRVVAFAAGRENPVPGAYTNARSLLSSRLYWLGNDLVGGRRCSLRAGRRHAHWPHRGHVQGNAGRPRPTVIKEGDGTRPQVAGAVQCVPHIEDAAVGLIVDIVNQQRTRGSTVTQNFAIERKFVFGDRTGLRRNRSGFGGGSGSVLCARSALCEQRAGANQADINYWSNRHNRPFSHIVSSMI